MKTLRFFAVLSMALMIFTACGEKIGSGAEQGDDGALQEELSVLFIGNSFTMDAVTHLPGMLSAAGIKKVHMVHMYYGGRPVSQYLKGWETFSDYTMYECLPGSNVWTETKNTNLSQVASSKKWDVVTIQEHSGDAAAWTWNTTAQNNIQGLMDKVKSVQGSESPKFYYILSQAYSDNAKIGQASLPYVTWADHTGMWTVVSAFARKVMDNIPFDGIISTGAMLENLRTSTINNSKYLTRDGFHMDKGIACYGASCTVFETIFTPVYNVKTSDISYTTSVSDANTTPVTSSNAPVAREAAKYAVLYPYTVKKMN
jgi:hypothetical protein